MAAPATPSVTVPNRGVRMASVTAGGLAVEKVVAALIVHYKADWHLMALSDSDIPFVAMGVAVGLTGAAAWFMGVLNRWLKREGLEA